VAVCWVLPHASSPAQIRGYYTLSASVGLRELPDEQARKLWRYPNVPAALLGRLAVDSKERGQRIGEHILMDAMAKVLEQSRRLRPMRWSLTPRTGGPRPSTPATTSSLPSNPLRLFLRVATIAQLFA